MTDALKRAFPYFLLAPAVLPLIYIGGVVYPYVAPKTFLLQGIGIGAIALFAYLALSGGAFFYERLRARASWIPGLLLVVAYGTSLFGIDFYHSFWGLFGRGDGLLTLTVITALFYLLLLFADRLFLERIAKIITAVAGIIASIAILQWLTTIFGDQAAFLPPVSGRIGSTLGNAAYLADYLAMALFVMLMLMRDSEGVWHRIAKYGAILSIIAVVLSATRGTILALCTAGVAALVLVSWKGNGKTARTARYGLVALVIIAGLFFVFRGPLSHSSFEPVRRIASISLSDGTVSSRLFVWSHILQESLQHPLSGYGAEQVAQLFDRVYDPSLISEQWFDRSHNAFLDYFVQYGIIGLALYVALLGVFARNALRLHRREASGRITMGFLFLLLILTYAVQNFFVFDTPSSLWLLYALFAFSLILLSDASALPLRQMRIPAALPGVVSAFLALLIIPAVGLPFYANILLTQGYKLHVIDVKTANEYFARGLALGTYADLEYGYQAYDMYTAHQAVLLTGEARRVAYDYALSLLTANFKKYPYDARTATYLGHVLDTAPPGVAVDDAFDGQVLSRAIALSPLRAQSWYMAANVPLRNINSSGDRTATYYRMAIAILEEYAQKEPTLAAPPFILATLYYKLGDGLAAQNQAAKGLALYTTPDITAAGPAVKYYFAIGDWRHAVPFLQDLVADNPSDYNTLYDLAKVSYLAGDPAAATTIVAKLRVNNPGILPTDQNFLTTITAYEQSRK